MVEPLGVNVEDWLAEFEKTREDRDRGRMTTADAFARALRGSGLEPADGLVEDLMRRDKEYTYAQPGSTTTPSRSWAGCASRAC